MVKANTKEEFFESQSYKRYDSSQQYEMEDGNDPISVYSPKKSKIPLASQYKWDSHFSNYVGVKYFI